MVHVIVPPLQQVYGVLILYSHPGDKQRIDKARRCKEGETAPSSCSHVIEKFPRSGSSPERQSLPPPTLKATRELLMRGGDTRRVNQTCGTWAHGVQVETGDAATRRGGRCERLDGCLVSGCPERHIFYPIRYPSMRLRVTRRAGGLRPGHYHLTGHRNVLLMYM